MGWTECRRQGGGRRKRKEGCSKGKGFPGGIRAQGTSLRVERRKLLLEETGRNFSQEIVPEEMALGNGRVLTPEQEGWAPGLKPGEHPWESAAFIPFTDFRNNLITEVPGKSCSIGIFFAQGFCFPRAQGSADQIKTNRFGMLRACRGSQSKEGTCTTQQILGVLGRGAFLAQFRNPHGAALRKS